MATETEPSASADPADEPVYVESRAELDDLVADRDVVLTDFYADWCGPCRLIEPVVERIAAETPATVAKVDVDVSGDLAGEFGVRGVPTLLLFAGGEQVEQLVGAQPEEQLRSLVERYSE
jgi:thioredoxin 1